MRCGLLGDLPLHRAPSSQLCEGGRENSAMTAVEFLQRCVVRGLIEILVSERGMTIPGALELIRRSRILTLLMYDETHLCR